MAHRLPLRTRTGPQRPKNADENAASKLRQAAGISLPGASRVVVNAIKSGPLQRTVLNEVTTTAINRKKNSIRLNAAKGKQTDSEVGQKRARSSSVALDGPQRPPLQTRAPSLQPSSSSQRVSLIQRPPTAVSQRVFTQPEAPVIISVDEEEEVENDIQHHVMDFEDLQSRPQSVADGLIVGDEEVEDMIDVQDSDEEDMVDDARQTAVRPSAGEYIWPQVSPNRAAKYQEELERIRTKFDALDAEYDVTMVSEYAEEIFEYMNELEDDIMPSPDYMSGQNEISWGMRQTLVDWLLQVHLRYHMLPETLWIAVNIVDRFLTQRVVSLVKLQLVGVTAMFIASKYEEILAPSAEEFAYMTENGYSKEEILKGERIVLQTLEFKISHYCSPYSWMRKISKADEYDIQTRTLSKFLAEVTLLDHRFLRVKPSMTAAIGMYTARRMLGGDWNEAFVHYSGYTEEQMAPGYQLIVEKIAEPGFEKLYLYKKYAHKKFLKAATYALEKAREQVALGDHMVLVE